MFEPFPLDIVLLALNRAYRKWLQGDNSYNLHNLKECEQGNPLFYWIVAETARHAIAWCLKRRYNSPIQLNYGKAITQQQIEQLMDVAMSIQLNLPVRSSEAMSHLTSDPILDTGCRLWLPQYLLQRSSHYRIGQSILLYKKAPERSHQRDHRFPLSEYNSILSSVLGCPLDFFILSCLQLQGISLSNNPCITFQRAVPIADRRYDNTIYDSHSSGIITPSVTPVIKLLSASPHVILKKTQQQLGRNDEFVMVDAPNPLLSYPLIQPFLDRSDCVIAPAPHLLAEWLYEPFINKLFSKCNSTFTNKHLSEIFEEYVGLVAELCAPDHQSWIHESDLQKGYSHSVVDWVKDLGDMVILIDAKRTFMENVKRYRSFPDDWKDPVDYLVKGVHQAATFWNNVKKGRVPALSKASHKPAIAVIVTHMDSDYRVLHSHTKKAIDARWKDINAPPPIPWIILAIDRYEQIMTQWSQTNDTKWMGNILWKAAKAENPKQILDEIPVIQEGPLCAEEEALVSKFKKEVEQQTISKK